MEPQPVHSRRRLERRQQLVLRYTLYIYTTFVQHHLLDFRFFGFSKAIDYLWSCAKSECTRLKANHRECARSHTYCSLPGQIIVSRALICPAPQLTSLCELPHPTVWLDWGGDLLACTSAALRLVLPFFSTFPDSSDIRSARGVRCSPHSTTYPSIDHGFD